MADILRLCFGLDKPLNQKSVEELFSDATRGGNNKPLERLVDRLMEADYRLAHKLASSNTSNCYSEFFGKFDDAQFLTFNYDSLPEIFLSRMERWYPEDGYGVPVATELAFAASPLANAKSTSFVLHLHGCSCFYTTEFDILDNPTNEGRELVQRTNPLYAFDPDSIASCFPRYRRMLSPTGIVRIDERVIAPVPDKAEGLKEPFIRETCREACSLVRASGNLVAIGYSFNRLDAASYRPILRSLAESGERKPIVVCPEANVLAARIQDEYPHLRVTPVEKTLKCWAADSFRY